MSVYNSTHDMFNLRVENDATYFMDVNSSNNPPIRYTIHFNPNGALKIEGIISYVSANERPDYIELFLWD